MAKKVMCVSSYRYGKKLLNTLVTVYLRPTLIYRL